MIIHQMLHGYNHGHNYIQGSIVLDSSHDMNKIAMLSDWSEYVNGKDYSYLTFYSLDESNYYVVAKTWYASEMSRPGCVWTHSLLICKDDLANISDFLHLQEYFVHPASAADYSKEIIYDDALGVQHQNMLDISDEALLWQMYSFIYEESTSLILPLVREFNVVQYLALQFFNNLPSGLLSKINLCTGTISERPFGNKNKTIIFSPSAVQGIFVMSETKFTFLDRLVTAVIYKDDQMSRLIRSFDNELGDSLDKFSAFLQLIDLFNQNLTVESEKEKNEYLIIEQLAKGFPYPSEGCRLKQRFLSKSATSYFMNEESFLYMMCVVDVSAFYKEDIHFMERVHSLFDASKEKYVALLERLIDSSENNAWGDLLLRDSVNLLSSEDWDILIKTKWYVFLSLASMTPSLLNHTSWQKIGKRQVKGVLDILSKESSRQCFTKYQELLDAIYIYNIQIDEGLANAISHHLSDFVCMILSKANSTGIFIDSLMRECIGKQDEVIMWMRNESNISQDVTTKFIISDLDPKSNIVKNSASALWRKVIYGSSMSLDYYIFIFVLSFNWYKDVDAIEYMKYAFIPIYKSVITSQITLRQWKKLENLMEPLKIWQDWDKGKKMRKTLAKRLKEAGLPKSYVSEFTPDDELNHVILKYWKKY